MNLKLIDLHNDWLTSGESSKNYNLAEKSGYKSIYALFKGERTLNEIKEIYSRAVSFGVHNFAFEDACYDEREEFDLFLAEVIPLYASLCWNFENDFAHGCKTQGGLKNDGRKFINRLNSLNIPLDLAHSNKQTFYEAADAAEQTALSHLENALRFVRATFGAGQELLVFLTQLAALPEAGRFLRSCALYAQMENELSPEHLMSEK